MRRNVVGSPDCALSMEKRFSEENERRAGPNDEDEVVAVCRHAPGGHTSTDGYHSSYLCKDLDYGEVLKSITVSVRPKTIVEYGILDGFSLNIFAQNSHNRTKN